ncbi:hypothetical protein EOD39_20545 [Acipenser ruthenus]|uniref:Uncharacterized protein n=1 Tax=Acipenser ruthenus TaxID=7906 RepID=A0A444UV95_ACIRT|nr:hypothetical protein EOD39_20545 [Acipenser ruthenus]
MADWRISSVAWRIKAACGELGNQVACCPFQEEGDLLPARKQKWRRGDCSRSLTREPGPSPVCEMGDLPPPPPERALLPPERAPLPPPPERTLLPPERALLPPERTPPPERAPLPPERALPLPPERAPVLPPPADALIHRPLFVHRQERRMRVHHRPSVWWEEVVLHESFSDEQWIETFRVVRATFDQLVELVRVDIEPSPIHVRTPVLLQKRVGIALYKLLGPLIRHDCAQQNGCPPQRELG